MFQYANNNGIQSRLHYSHFIEPNSPESESLDMIDYIVFEHNDIHNSDDETEEDTEEDTDTMMT